MYATPNLCGARPSHVFTVYRMMSSHVRSNIFHVRRGAHDPLLMMCSVRGAGDRFGDYHTALPCKSGCNQFTNTKFTQPTIRKSNSDEAAALPLFLPPSISNHASSSSLCSSFAHFPSLVLPRDQNMYPFDQASYPSHLSK